MARRKIREYDAKKILQEQLSALGVMVPPFQAVLIDASTDFQAIPHEHLWLQQKKLVIKPDQLFGKRKQYGLVLIDVDVDAVQEYLKKNLGKEMIISKAAGKLTHFLIEPFVPHTKEYYLSLVSMREGMKVYFSAQGGFNIEERWDTISSLFVPTLESITKEEIQRTFPGLPGG